MAFGVIACNAIKVIIARLVGSAIAWKMSRLILFKFIVAQTMGCKYMCNYSVSQIFFYFTCLLEVCRVSVTMTTNIRGLPQAGYLLHHHDIHSGARRHCASNAGIGAFYFYGHERRRRSVVLTMHLPAGRQAHFFVGS